MLYRKPTVAAPRLLLRIGVGVGAGALVSLSGCSSDTNTIQGFASLPPSDGGADVELACGVGYCGIGVAPPAAEGGPLLTGSVAAPPDAGDDAGGADAATADGDAGDAKPPCGTGFCGSVVMPQDAGEDAASDD